MLQRARVFMLFILKALAALLQVPSIFFPEEYELQIPGRKQSIDRHLAKSDVFIFHMLGMARPEGHREVVREM